MTGNQLNLPVRRNSGNNRTG